MSLCSGMGAALVESTIDRTNSASTTRQKKLGYIEKESCVANAVRIRRSTPMRGEYPMNAIYEGETSWSPYDYEACDGHRGTYNAIYPLHTFLNHLGRHAEGFCEGDL